MNPRVLDASPELNEDPAYFGRRLDAFHAFTDPVPFIQGMDAWHEMDPV